ncbi:MAG: endonuclease/exonuclease/phosphatase family protein [Muribaculaceae bacterium]
MKDLLRTICAALVLVVALPANSQIRFAHWNIGHFAVGADCRSHITADSSAIMQKCYAELLACVNPDIVGVCEFSPEFSPGVNASDAVFGTFCYQAIGEKYEYNCNCLFSRVIPLSDFRQVMFGKMVQTRYYTACTVRIDSVDVVVVETHLDWNQGKDGYNCRCLQIKELIEAFAQYSHVVIAGDFNTSRYGIDEYAPFVEAGYLLANGIDNNPQATYPAAKPKKVLDNILVKGLQIENFRVESHPLLSDHCLLYCDILF